MRAEIWLSDTLLDQTKCISLQEETDCNYFPYHHPRWVTPRQIKFVSDLRLLNKRDSWIKYRSATKVDLVIRLRDLILLARPINSFLNMKNMLHAAFGIVDAQVCVYPHTPSQSFLFPEAIDAEGVLAILDLNTFSLPHKLTHSYSFISDSFCQGPSSKNSLALC